MEPSFSEATLAEANEALRAAHGAFDGLRTASVETRATFLETLAEEILALGDALL